MAAHLGISKEVTFTGAMDNADAMAYLSKGDLLVLPSRWEGWGVVVNEALVRGVPVICSSRCGASDLLLGIRGSIFRADSVRDLGQVLLKRLNSGKLSPETRAGIREWAMRNISGATAANYLLNIPDFISGDGSRPIAPWLRKI